MKILDITKIQTDYKTLEVTIPDEYLAPQEEYRYSIFEDQYALKMKPVGRVYYGQLKNFNYTDGTPVECALVSGGEAGVEKRFLRAGVPVYTSEQVELIINNRCYESNNNMKPRISNELANFLRDVAAGTAKNKPTRAKELLDKYEVVGETKLEESK